MLTKILSECYRSSGPSTRHSLNHRRVRETMEVTIEDPIEVRVVDLQITRTEPAPPPFLTEASTLNSAEPVGWIQVFTYREKADKEGRISTLMWANCSSRLQKIFGDVRLCFKCCCLKLGLCEDRWHDVPNEPLRYAFWACSSRWTTISRVWYWQGCWFATKRLKVWVCFVRIYLDDGGLLHQELSRRKQRRL